MKTFTMFIQKTNGVKDANFPPTRSLDSKQHQWKAQLTLVKSDRKFQNLKTK